MIEAPLRHLVCPETLRPLRLDNGLSGGLVSDDGTRYPIHMGVPDFVGSEAAENQTVRSFCEKWSKHRYYREHTRKFYTDWFLQRYGFLTTQGLREFLSGRSFILDAGTGSGRDALNFAELSSATVYGIDTAMEALEVARREVSDPRVIFVRADAARLPFPDGFFDFINCDQVIHHTPDPRATFEHLRRKLKPGGSICCYVYRKKAVIREFVDDHVREQISRLPFEEALALCEPITRLGRTLADVKVSIDVDEDIPLLGIKKGKIDLQRFFHWNILKCFWNDGFDFFTNNVVNVDWYHPEFCFRFEPDEFRAWFDGGWSIESWDVREAGMSCRAIMT